MSELGIVARVDRLGLEELLAVIADPEDEWAPADARCCLEMLKTQLTVAKQ